MGGDITTTTTINTITITAPTALHTMVTAAAMVMATAATTAIIPTIRPMRHIRTTLIIHGRGVMTWLMWHLAGRGATALGGRWRRRW